MGKTVAWLTEFLLLWFSKYLHEQLQLKPSIVPRAAALIALQPVLIVVTRIVRQTNLSLRQL